MQKPFKISSTLLYGMTKIYHALNTMKEQMSHLTYRMTNEKIEKDQQRDYSKANIMTQMDLLSKHVMGSSSKVLIIVEVTLVNPDELKF